MNETLLIFIILIVILTINLYSYYLINNIEENFETYKENVYKYKGPYSISNQYTIFKNKLNNQAKNYHKNIELKIINPFNDKIMYYYNKYI